MRNLLALAIPALLFTALVAGACGDDDDDAGIGEPTPTATRQATQPTGPAQVEPTATNGPADGPTQPSAEFGFASTAFAEGERIPTKHTCDGENVSPGLAWFNLPPGTEELALVVDDPDAPGGSFIHWVLYAIPASETGLLEGAQTGSFGPNGGGSEGYFGPCPPPGDGDHRYQFTLFALSGTLRFVQPPTAADLLAAVDGITLAQTTLTGLYSR